MKLNTNSNTYTILYAVIVVIVVAFLLSFTFSALNERSLANERIDKKQQILAALNLRNISKETVEEKYKDVVEADLVVDANGQVKEQGAEKDKAGFAIDRKEMTADQLPVFVCKVDGQTKYVLPIVGKGLWGPIWGFIALNEDKQTVYGAYFSHDSETAGLGSLIKEEKFQKEFEGKRAVDKDGNALLAVVKSGKVQDAATEVDGITGATLTSNGVNDMIREYLTLYKGFLKSNQDNTIK